MALVKRCTLAVMILFLVAPIAFAGPNEGGVLWVHDTGIVFSTDLARPPVSAPPADCAGVDNQQDADGVERVWKVYAAFPPGSFPRLKTVAWGIKFPDVGTSASSYVNVSGGGLPNEDGAGTDFDLETDGFPTTSGGMIGQSFPTGPRLTTVVALYWFYGFGYNTSGPLPTFELVGHIFGYNRIFGDDATPANEDPITAYGSLGFGTPGSTPCPEVDQNVACCNPTTGACVVMRKSTCVEPSFWQVLFTSPPDIWAGPWSTCTPNPCPPPTGACCYSSGECRVLTCHPTWNPVTRVWAPCPDGVLEDPGDPLSRRTTEALCRATGGVYKGDGVLCASDPCDAPAACCFPSGFCLIRIESACEAFYPPGIWHSEWAACTPNPCPQPPTGACCAFAGTCTVTTQSACASGNTWHDDWETCDANGRDPCPQPQGTCCDPLRGGCVVAEEAECLAPGVWQLDPSSCSPNPCPQPPRGVCCSFPRTCVINLYEVDCANVGDIWHPEWLVCLPQNPCPEPPPTGGCCTANGECTITLSAVCPETSVWHIGWITCSPNACPPPACPIVSTGLPLTLLLSGVYLDGAPVQPGDLLCVTDADQDSLPVGATTLGGSYPLLIKVWQEDPGFGLPGAACGDSIGYRLHVNATGASYTDAVAVYTTGDGLFCGEPYTSVTLRFGSPPPPPGACCSRNAFCRILPQARCLALRGTFYPGICNPANPGCYVPGSKGGLPLDDSAPVEKKGSWGQIKNRYR